MPDLPEYRVRRRVNVSSSTKGILTFDCTVEIISPLENDPLDGSKNDPILAESKDMVTKLKEEYPLQVS